MPVQNTSTSISATQSRMDAYFQSIERHIRAISNDPSMRLGVEELESITEKTLEFVRDNTVLTAETKMKPGTRFKSQHYNDLIDSAKIDLEVAYARLRGLIKIINSTSAIISGKTYSTLSNIDQMLDRLANLSNLKNTFSQYDDVIYNTFITDDNDIEDFDFKSKHGEAGGIITIKDTSTDFIVESERNFDIFVESINKNTVIKTFNSHITTDSMVDAMDVSIYSYDPLYLKDYELGLNEDDTTADALTYNGGTLAVILRLPAIKLINNISMKYASAGLTDVLQMFYTRDLASTVDGNIWRSIDFTVDTNNIRGSDINFSTKEAGAIMIILGQKSSKLFASEADKGFETMVRGKEFNLSEMVDSIEENSNVVTKHRLKEYASPQVVETLSEDTARITNAIIQQLENMLPPEERGQTELDANNFNEILEYNFSLYAFELNYIHYFNTSTYKSDIRGGDGTIAGFALTANGTEASTSTVSEGEMSLDTTINHYVELANGQHRMLPSSQPKAKDIFTVEDPEILRYTSDLLMKASSVKVYINNEFTTLYTLVKQHSTSTIALGIDIDSNNVSLNFGDTILIYYEVSDVDTNGKQYNPYEVTIDDLLGNPILLDQSLTKGERERALVKMDDGSFISYEFPTEIYEAFMPASGGSDDPEIAYLLKHRKVDTME
jgi:hypothetical protein